MTKQVQSSVDGKTLKSMLWLRLMSFLWGEIGVDVVLECTGFYCSKDKAQAHIEAGAKKVVISAPAGNDLPTIVYSVNEKTLTADDKIISADHAQQTASLLWLRLLTSMQKSRAVSCPPSTLTQAIR